MSPQRIQRKRVKGWRMPEGAVYVGRGSIFGNPFTCRTEPQRAVDAFSGFIKHAGSLFTWQLGGGLDLVGSVHYDRPREMRAALDSIRGKDLACWCPIDKPCHADVLLELANGAAA